MKTRAPRALELPSTKGPSSTGSRACHPDSGWTGPQKLPTQGHSRATLLSAFSNLSPRQATPFLWPRVRVTQALRKAAGYCECSKYLSIARYTFTICIFLQHSSSFTICLFGGCSKAAMKLKTGRLGRDGASQHITNRCKATDTGFSGLQCFLRRCQRFEQRSLSLWLPAPRWRGARRESL